MLAGRFMPPTRPMPSRSSGTKDSATPFSRIFRGDRPSSSSAEPSSSRYCTLLPISAL